MTRRLAPPALLGALLLGLALLFVARPALAHQSSVTYSKLVVRDDGRVEYGLQLSSRDLFEALALDRDRDATDEEIRAGAAKLFAYVGERIQVADGERVCAITPGAVDVVTQADRFARLSFTAACGRPIGTLAVDYDLFFDLDPRHVGMIEIRRGDDLVRRELTAGSSRLEWDLAGPPPGSLGFVDYVSSGVEHIFTGYDHICFVIALVLIAPLRRKGVIGAVLKTVTAFTVAHSFTLIAAALGWIELPSRLVESVIAASIVYIAVENLLVAEPRGRAWLAFGFGLVHGLGFASLLKPLLPPDEVVVPLLAFNLGVELGQVAIVSVLLPVLVVAAQKHPDGYRRVALRGGSVLVGLFGLLWLVDRVFEVETISRWL